MNVCEVLEPESSQCNETLSNIQNDSFIVKNSGPEGTRTSLSEPFQTVTENNT